LKENDLIINFCPTGMIPTKDMTLHVPLTVSEIVEDVHQACEIGITMLHLHARDPETGAPAWEPEIYADIIKGIRMFAPDLIICVSTSGRIFNDFEKRGACLFLKGDIKPDMASLTLSSLNFNKIPSINSPDMIIQLAKHMAKTGIKPELEVFDVGMINYAHYLIKKKILTPPYYFNLILGNVACAQANLLHAGIMIQDLPANSFWSLAGVGDSQLRMNSVSMAIGGGVRVGLEDNIWLDQRRTRLATNVDLLTRVYILAQANERVVVSSERMRKYLCLQPGYGKYGVKDEK
jgi:3-keto-5-aminohexanoate cleavage enzyme